MLLHFKERFPRLGPVIDKYIEFQKRVEVPAKTVLLEEGKLSAYYYFVVKGCIRSKFNNNGEEKTVQFFFENEGLTSLESFINDTPSAIAIETIEPTVLQLLPKEKLNALIDDCSHEPAFMKLIFRILAERQIHYINQYISSIKDSPEQRYRNLQSQSPHVIQRVPQHYIASYLGITTVHLSRIKSKVAKGLPQF